MGEFFKDSRRMNGCTLLLLACVFMISWFRSIVIRDEVHLEIKDGREGHLIRSHEQAIRVVYWHYWGRYTVVEETLLFVPHWSLVLPLTLLSAWLILVKPRKPKSAPFESSEVAETTDSSPSAING